MIKNPLIFAATSDVAGKVRGKAFPVSDLEKRAKRGVGWTPTNVMITCFDAMAVSILKCNTWIHFFLKAVTVILP